MALSLVLGHEGTQRWLSTVEVDRQDFRGWRRLTLHPLPHHSRCSVRGLGSLIEFIVNDFGVSLVGMTVLSGYA